MHIHWWLFLHGIGVDGVVNSERHQNYIKGRRFSGRAPSKYPLAFGIDQHVDDSIGVQMEGEQYGFRTIVVVPEDENWVEKILDAVVQRA